jgi:predicted  nucleic acid-binding Zn-ribbon protein
MRCDNTSSYDNICGTKKEQPEYLEKVENVLKKIRDASLSLSEVIDDLQLQLSIISITLSSQNQQIDQDNPGISLLVEQIEQKQNQMKKLKRDYALLSTIKNYKKN